MKQSFSSLFLLVICCAAVEGPALTWTVVPGEVAGGPPPSCAMAAVEPATGTVPTALSPVDPSEAPPRASLSLGPRGADTRPVVADQGEATLTLEGTCAKRVHLVGGTWVEDGRLTSRVGSREFAFREVAFVDREGAVWLSGRVAPKTGPSVLMDEHWVRWHDGATAIEPRFAEEGTQAPGAISFGGLRIRTSTKGQELLLGGFGRPEKCLLRSGDTLPRSEGKWVVSIEAIVEAAESGVALVQVNVGAPGRRHEGEGLVVLPDGQLVTQDEVRVGLGGKPTPLGSPEPFPWIYFVFDTGLVFVPRPGAAGEPASHMLRLDGTFAHKLLEGQPTMQALRALSGYRYNREEPLSSHPDLRVGHLNKDQNEHSVFTVSSSGDIVTFPAVGRDEAGPEIEYRGRMQKPRFGFADVIGGLKDGGVIGVLSRETGYNRFQHSVALRHPNGTLEELCSQAIKSGAPVVGHQSMVYYGEAPVHAARYVGCAGALFEAQVGPNTLGSKASGVGFFALKQRKIEALIVPGAKVHAKSGEVWTVETCALLGRSSDGRFAYFVVRPAERRPDGAHFDRYLMIELPEPL